MYLAGASQTRHTEAYVVTTGKPETLASRTLKVHVEDGLHRTETPNNTNGLNQNHEGKGKCKHRYSEQAPDPKPGKAKGHYCSRHQASTQAHLRKP